MNVRNLPAPMKRVVHLGSRSYGRITSPARMTPSFLICGGQRRGTQPPYPAPIPPPARMTPSFLICGGQRCGTTSLYRALAAHPAVLKAVLHKGVHYFDTSYHRGMAWYRGHFPLQRSGDKVAQKYGVPAQTFES